MAVGETGLSSVTVVVLIVELTGMLRPTCDDVVTGFTGG